MEMAYTVTVFIFGLVFGSFLMWWAYVYLSRSPLCDHPHIAQIVKGS